MINPLSQVSWREGLHHHGEDEQLAGYTLQELLGLANSRLTQQRMLAFDALAGVIRNARLQRGDRTLWQAPLLLLQAGLVRVSTWIIDSEIRKIFVYPKISRRGPSRARPRIHPVSDYRNKCTARASWTVDKDRL